MPTLGLMNCERRVRTKMGHKTETLQAITGLLEKDYPRAMFRYGYERERIYTGLKMFPDVQIYEGRANIPICVVEIGYTRPEKLAHYKEIGIRDIRWYGLNDHKLYSYGDVQSITATVKLNCDLKLHPNDVWYSVLMEEIEPTGSHCFPTHCTLFDFYQRIKGLPTRMQKLRLLAKERDAAFGDHEQFFSRQEIIDLAEDFDSDLVMNNLGVDVFNTLYSNGVGAFMHTFCDVCGACYVEAPDEIGSVGAWCLAQDTFSSWGSFLYHSKRQARKYRNLGAETKPLNTEQLVEMLDDIENVPMVFDAALSWGKALPWLGKPKARVNQEAA
jgi:hypothetical protein